MRVPLNVLVLPDTKFAIESLAAMLQRTAGAVVDLMSTSYLTTLPPDSRSAIEGLKTAAVFHAAAPNTLDASAPPATYNFSRFCFSREVIESLGQNDPPGCDACWHIPDDEI